MEYHLTSLGQSLLPVIEVMEQWGNAHRTELEQALAESLEKIPEPKPTGTAAAGPVSKVA